jgi:hypothetical protein
MTNMSYCRFHNTLSDLRDCEGALEEMLVSMNMSKEAREEERVETFKDLSPSEARAAQKLIDLCRTIHEDYGEDDDVMDALESAKEKN